MRHQPATIILLATLTSAIIACDPEPKSIGSQDGESEETNGDGDGECGPSQVDLEFEVHAPASAQGLTLTCAAAVSPTSKGYTVELTNCIDAQAMPQADVSIDLIGDWSEPLIDGEPQIELRYVWFSAVVNEHVNPQRWLSLRNPGGQFPLALLAVDAVVTDPATLSPFEFDYAPFAVEPAETDCPLIENPGCAPIQPGALDVSIDEQLFTIPHGRESTITVGSDGYHVVVEKAHGLIVDCPQPSDGYVFNIVATPNS